MVGGGFGGAAFAAIVAPHAGGRVFFAGEHTCAAFQGYVHGGLGGWPGGAGGQCGNGGGGGGGAPGGGCGG